MAFLRLVIGQQTVVLNVKETAAVFCINRHLTVIRRRASPAHLDLAPGFSGYKQVSEQVSRAFEGLGLSSRILSVEGGYVILRADCIASVAELCLRIWIGHTTSTCLYDATTYADLRAWLSESSPGLYHEVIASDGRHLVRLSGVTYAAASIARFNIDVAFSNWGAGSTKKIEFADAGERDKALIHFSEVLLTARSNMYPLESGDVVCLDDIDAIYEKQGTVWLRMAEYMIAVPMSEKAYRELQSAFFANKLI